MLRFNAFGPAALVNRKAPGSLPKLNKEQRQALTRIVKSGLIPAVHGMMRLQRKDLAHRISEAFQISLNETTIGRELKSLSFAKPSARPHRFAQNEIEVAGFKQTSRPNWRPLGQGSCRTS